MRVLILSPLLLLTINLSAQYIPDNHLPNRIPFRKGEFWGYCDQNKELKIPATFLWAEPFVEGMAVVRLDSLTESVIDESGIEICRTHKDTLIYISDSGRIYKSYNQKVIAVRERNGKWFSSLKYQIKWVVGKDFYLAMYKNKYGLIDKNEKIVLPFKYSYISDIDEHGYFLVKKRRKQGYINLKAKKLFKFKQNRYQLGSFSEGLAVISEQKKKKEVYGYINRKGDLVIPMIYHAANKFKNNMAEVQGFNLSRGLINPQGDTINSFTYGSIFQYSNGYFSYDVFLNSVLYDAKGNEILKTKYDLLRYVNDSIIIVARKEPGQLGSYKYGIIDISGKEIIACTNYEIYGGMNDPLIYVAETWSKRYYMDYKLNKYYEE